MRVVCISDTTVPDLTKLPHSPHVGLVSIATTVGSTLLAFPGRQIGHVQMVRLPPLQDPSEMPRPGAKPDAHASAHAPPPYPIVHIFLAHSSALRTLTLSSTGFLLCTSSNKGTLLRVFSTSHKALIRELRRGTDQADVWSVAFLDPNAGEMIACASDKRTVHVWKVGDLSLTSSVASGSGQSAAKTTSPGPSSSGKGKEAMKAFNILKPYLPAYFSSQWSDLTWRIPHNASVTFQPVHVAALAEQDDLATCFFVRTQTDANRTREQQARNKQSATARHGGSQAEDPCYLLVITRSGAWYKLSLSNPISASSSPSTARSGSSSAHAHQGRRKDAAQPSSGSAATKPGATSAGGTVPESNKCRLLEYRRIGYGTDGEEDDHNRDFDIDIDFDRDSDSDSDE